MTATILKMPNTSVNTRLIEENIESHATWMGSILGLKAEQMLRGQAPGTFALRAGERPQNYYVTFVDSAGDVRHQPFEISYVEGLEGIVGWEYTNHGKGGPFPPETTVDAVLPAIMHFVTGEIIPFVSTIK